MLTENEAICLHQTCVTGFFTAFSLKPVACKKERKKKGGGDKLTVHRLRSGGIRVVCVYLLITARLVLCGEGCLTVTLLGSAI